MVSGNWKKRMIGTGNTADVYDLDDGKVLKLFHLGYKEESVKLEYQNAKAIWKENFSKPRVYDLINQEGRYGIIYERVDGISLQQWVFETKNLEQCANYMAQIHKKILQCKIKGISNYKDILRYFVQEATKEDLEQREDVLNRITLLEDGDTLCHGDFHPDNVILNGDKTTVIDFFNICYGNPLYDIARTVYLVQYTPVPVGCENVDEMKVWKEELAECYLRKMGVRREKIKDYLSVIEIMRRAECPS